MFVSDTAYDSFMGRFSTRLAPLFADFARCRSRRRRRSTSAPERVRSRTSSSAAGRTWPLRNRPRRSSQSLHRRFPGVDVREAGAEELPWPDASFDAALAQLVVAFMHDAPAGLREMRRVVRPGGTVAVCMWDRDGMEMLAAVNRTRDALGHPREEGLYRTRSSIEELVGDGAESELLEVEALYSDFEDFWRALAGGAGPAGAWAASLDDAGRAAARSELFRQLGEPHGPFELTGRAWAARVTRA